MSQRFNESMNQWITCATNQCIKHSTIQWVNESLSHWINESMNQWFKNSVSQWINDAVNQRMKESMNQWINGSTSQWVNESGNQWISETTSCQRYETIYQYEPMVQRFSESKNESLNSWAKKRSMPVFLNMWRCKSSSRYSLAHILFVDNFRRFKARNRGNKDPTSVMPEATLPERTQGFVPESVFTLEFTPSHLLRVLVLYCSHLQMTMAWCWHDDGDDDDEMMKWWNGGMMRWWDDDMMTWWWQDDNPTTWQKWQNDKTAPGHSSITQKFSN